MERVAKISVSADQAEPQVITKLTNSQYVSDCLPRIQLLVVGAEIELKSTMDKFYFNYTVMILGVYY